MAPRVTREPRPLPTWGGRRRKGAPRCSSGGSPSRSAAAAGVTAAAVAPSSWQPHREPSFQLPAGHDSSAVVAKVAVDHSSASSSSGYCSPRDEVSTSSLQPPCMSWPSGCSPQQPGLATCVADADGANAVVSASSGNPSAALPSLLPEEEEPLSPALQMGVAVPEEEEEEPLWRTLQMEVALQMVVAKFMVFYFDAHEKRTLSTDYVKSLSPALRLEAAIEILFRFDLARKKRILSADELDLIIDIKSQLACLEAEVGEVNAHGTDVVVVEEEEEEEFLSPSQIMEAALKIMFRLDLARERRILSADELDLYDNMKSLLPRLEAKIGEDNADGVDAVDEEEEEAKVDNADGADAVEEEAAEEEPLSPAVQKEVAIEILFRLDLARKKRVLSAGELDLIIFLKSQLVRLDAEIGEVNEEEEEEEEEEEGEGEEDEEEPLSPALEMEAALKVMFRLDLAREMRILSTDELDLYDDMKSLLTCLEAEVGDDTADGADAVEEEDADGAHAVGEEEEEEAKEDNADGANAVAEEEEPLSPALQKEVAIEILFRLDLARKKRILSAGELDLIIFLKSQLARLDAEIGEVNEEEEEEEEEEDEEEPLSPALEMEAVLKVMFRLDLAREMRILSANELDLYDDMKSLLTYLEAEVGEDTAGGVDAVEEEEVEEEEEEEPLLPELQKEAALQMVLAKFILFYFDAHEKRMFSTDDLESISPALKLEVAIEILFQFDLASKKRILSADELDLIIHLKSQLSHLEAEIGEINAHGADAVEEEEEEEEEQEKPLSPSRKMEAALKIMFRLDLAREMRILSVDELDLYDDMKSLLPRLEAEIGEATAAPSITLEDPPTCQLHAPSVALAGANEVPSPMVPGASTSIKLSADLQLAERSIVATNAELSTPGPEATPSVLNSSAEPEPAVEDDEITEALYGHSVHRRRLPIFRGICPE